MLTVDSAEGGNCGRHNNHQNTLIHEPPSHGWLSRSSPLPPGAARDKEVHPQHKGGFGFSLCRHRRRRRRRNNGGWRVATIGGELDRSHNGLCSLPSKTTVANQSP